MARQKSSPALPPLKIKESHEADLVNRYLLFEGISLNGIPLSALMS